MRLTQMLVQAEEVLNSGGQMTTWDWLAMIGLGSIIYFVWRFIRGIIAENHEWAEIRRRIREYEDE